LTISFANRYGSHIHTDVLAVLSILYIALRAFSTLSFFYCCKTKFFCGL